MRLFIYSDSWLIHATAFFFENEAEWLVLIFSAKKNPKAGSNRISWEKPWGMTPWHTLAWFSSRMKVLGFDRDPIPATAAVPWPAPPRSSWRRPRGGAWHAPAERRSGAAEPNEVPTPWNLATQSEVLKALNKSDLALGLSEKVLEILLVSFNLVWRASLPMFRQSQACFWTLRLEHGHKVWVFHPFEVHLSPANPVGLLWPNHVPHSHLETSSNFWQDECEQNQLHPPIHVQALHQTQLPTHVQVGHAG